MVSIQFIPADFSEVSAAIKQHLSALPSAIDSFLEDHITMSAQYQIVVSG